MMDTTRSLALTAFYVNNCAWVFGSVDSVSVVEDKYIVLHENSRKLHFDDSLYNQLVKRPDRIKVFDKVIDLEKSRLIDYDWIQESYLYINIDKFGEFFILLKLYKNVLTERWK